MCLTAPVRILDLDGVTAKVAVGSTTRTASALLVPDARPGDWALMSAGTIVRLLDPALAAELAAAVRTAAGEQP